MSVWAIVPVKPFAQGKSRLAGVLTDAERIALNRSLFNHTLRSIQGARGVHQVCVISGDPEVLALATSSRAWALQEGTNSNLNRAIAQTTEFMLQNRACGVLIVPADLPLLNPASIEAMLERSSDPPVMVITPDSRGEGTNGLLLSPPLLTHYLFGAQSFRRHIELARQKGMRVEVWEDPCFSLDLDLPEDLQALANPNTP